MRICHFGTEIGDVELLGADRRLHQHVCPEAATLLALAPVDHGGQRVRRHAIIVLGFCVHLFLAGLLLHAQGLRHEEGPAEGDVIDEDDARVSPGVHGHFGIKGLAVGESWN